MIEPGALDRPGGRVPVGEGPAEGRGGRAPRGLVEGLAAIGEQATFGGHGGRRGEQRQAELDFQSRARNHVLALQSGINGYADEIEALRALFESSDRGVSRGEFERFADRILQGQRGIFTVSWIPRVKRGERAQHEAGPSATGSRTTASRT